MVKKQSKGNILIFIASLIILGATIVSSRVLVDAKSPEITIVNENFKFSCLTKYEDLLNNAYATDENLKYFFIENEDINDIVEAKAVKYVAIDKSGNVTKKVLPLNLTQDVYNYSISLKKDFVVQMGEEVNFHDYFELKNHCGWKKEGIFNVSGYDLNNVSVYDVIISSPNAEDLALEMAVIDTKTPVIKLFRNEITLYVDEDFDFKENIQEISDDFDSQEDLMDSLKIEKDDLSKVGEHVVTYKTVDSDGNRGIATIVVTVKERPKETPSEETNREESSENEENRQDSPSYTDTIEEVENINQDSSNSDETSENHEENNQDETAID